MNSPVATVLITTKNRRLDLPQAIRSVLSQTVPVELLIVDDGSTDGTADLVRQQFPEAVLLRNETSLGIIAARNRAAQQASTDILFTLDDDAVYSDATVIERVVADFAHPRVAVVDLPLVDHIGEQRIVHDAYMDQTALRTNPDFPCLFFFRGGANALRRKLFLDLGGYEGSNRQREEHTYCVRLLAAGYVVRLASHGHVNHFPLQTPRDQGQVYEFGARNGVLFTTRYVPFPAILIHLPAQCLGHLRRGVRQGQFQRVCRGLGQGFLQACQAWRERKPIARSTYRLMRTLIRQRPLPFSVLQPHLPPQETSASSPPQASAP